MQTMGTHYVAWKTAKDIQADNVPQMNEAMRNEYKILRPWPHSRLRAMKKLVPPDTAVTPWLAPSNPWWDLGGAWNMNALVPRRRWYLVGSAPCLRRWASILSFDLEAGHLRLKRGDYREVTKHRLLSATKGRHALLALFHPSPLLVAATEPLAADRLTRAGVRKHLRHQLRQVLSELGVGITPDSPHTSTLGSWSLGWKLAPVTGRTCSKLGRE